MPRKVEAPICLICEHCGNPFTWTKAEGKDYRWCSKECEKEHNRVMKEWMKRIHSIQEAK